MIYTWKGKNNYLVATLYINARKGARQAVPIGLKTFTEVSPLADIGIVPWSLWTFPYYSGQPILIFEIVLFLTQRIFKSSLKISYETVHSPLNFGTQIKLFHFFPLIFFSFFEIPLYLLESFWRPGPGCRDSVLTSIVATHFHTYVFHFPTTFLVWFLANECFKSFHVRTMSET